MRIIPSYSVYLTFWMCLYGVGVGVSQSMMSLASTFLAFAGLSFSFREIYQHKFETLRKAPEVFFVLSLLVYLVLNITLRPFDERSTVEALKWAPLFLVLLSCGSGENFALSEKQKKYLYLLTISAVWISCLFGLFQFVVSQGAPAISFFRNPIYLAYNLFPAFIFFTESFFANSNKWKKIDFITAVLIGLTLLATLNRFVPFCVAIYFAVKLFTLRNRQHRMWVLGAGFFAAICFLSVYFLSPIAQEKFGRGLSLVDISLRGRLTIWSHNWGLFLENPLFGVGPFRNWVDTAIHTQWTDLWSSGVRIYGHSVYLQSLADSGILGLILLLGSLYFVSRSHRTSFFIFVFVFLLGGITENILNNSKPFHGLLFYLILPKVLGTSRESRL